jgi:type IV secretory pathway ATPase VirB11/archaellum biosynthesis ATPase
MTVSPIKFGPLESLLADPVITAIYIDSQNVRYTKAGQTLASDIVFESDVQ